MRKVLFEIRRNRLVVWYVVSNYGVYCNHGTGKLECACYTVEQFINPSNQILRQFRKLYIKTFKLRQI